MPPDKQSRNTCSTSYSLIADLRQQDAHAWDRLIALYTPMVCYWCRKLDVAEQDVADVSQEVFQSVAKNIDRFRKERPQDTFRGWLRTITHNKAMDHFRRQKNRPHAAGGTVAQHRMSEVPDVRGVESDVDEERPLRQQLFLRALESIRGDFHERTWLAFWRVVVDGQSPKDVAEELSMRPGTVRVAKSRVLHRLRRELGELLE